MAQSTSNSGAQSAAIAPSHTPHGTAWYRPMISPEHGVYVVLLVSFLTGAAAAQGWTIATTLALICAFLGFQAEHPLVMQVKQRKSLKPRFLAWGGLYAGVALAIALYLYFHHHSGVYHFPLLWIYGGAIGAFLVDAISVFHREQKSVFNEFITFTAVCLSAPFAYVVTIGHFSALAIGLWILNTLFFASTIFTVKFRKSKSPSIVPSAGYHLVATVIIAGLYWAGILSGFTASAFAVVLLKFALILWQQNWYRTTAIRNVALLETSSALLFLVIVALSVLPAHL